MQIFIQRSSIVVGRNYSKRKIKLYLKIHRGLDYSFGLVQASNTFTPRIIIESTQQA